MAAITTPGSLERTFDPGYGGFLRKQLKVKSRLPPGHRRGSSSLPWSNAPFPKNLFCVEGHPSLGVIIYVKKLMIYFSYSDYIFLGKVVSLFGSDWSMKILKRVDRGPPPLHSLISMNLRRIWQIIKVINEIKHIHF